MNKRHWIHVGPYGRHNKIGLMHGDGSGNLMIYYNDKVIVIDFKVFESKSYKFFVDEELCEIFIIKHKKKNSYRYEFKFDNKTKTDLNIRRNAKIKRSNTIGIIVTIAVPLLIASVVLGYSRIRKAYLEYQIKHYEETSWAKIRIYHDYHIQKSFYFFTDNKGESIDSKRIVSPKPQTPHGLPIEDGDIFSIKYVSKHPFYNKINYDEPDPATAIKLMQRVAPIHLQHNQGRIQQELLCEIQAAYDLEGLEGLSKIFHQQVAASKNPTYNRESFLKLKRDSPFQKAVDQCWNAQVY